MEGEGGLSSRKYKNRRRILHIILTSYPVKSYIYPLLLLPMIRVKCAAWKRRAMAAGVVPAPPQGTLPTIHTAQWPELRETRSLSSQDVTRLDTGTGIRRELLHKWGLEGTAWVALDVATGNLSRVAVIGRNVLTFYISDNLLGVFCIFWLKNKCFDEDRMKALLK